MVRRPYARRGRRPGGGSPARPAHRGRSWHRPVIATIDSVAVHRSSRSAGSPSRRPTWTATSRPIRARAAGDADDLSEVTPPDGSRRVAPDFPRRAPLRRPAAFASAPEPKWRSVPAEQASPPCDHHAAARVGGAAVPSGQRRQRGGTIRDLDRVEPQDDVVRRAGTPSGNPGLRRAPGPGRIPSRPASPGCGVAASVPESPERTVASRVARRAGARRAANAPCPQPMMPSLTSNRRRIYTRVRPSRDRSERVASERLADGCDPADRQVRRTNPDRVPPGVAEVGDDDMAGRSVARRSISTLAVDQQPATLGRRSCE